jgi:hypothetical protein
VAGILHIAPQGDLITHDTSSTEADCVCGPRTVPVEQKHGGYGWLIVHHSLDGREREESNDA